MPKKILIIEDEKSISKAYSDLLIREGYKTEIATTAEEAVKTIQQDKPDLVILDILLPGGKGYSVLEFAKNSNEYSKIPIIVASNIDNEQDIKKAYDLGADDYILKMTTSVKGIIDKVLEYIK